MANILVSLLDRPVVQFPKDYPKNQTLAEGENVTFYCKMIGNPETVQHKWQFNGIDIPGASCDNGCPFLRYTKRGVTQQDAGLYSCIGWNELGYGSPATAELFVGRKYHQWVLNSQSIPWLEKNHCLLTSLLRETCQYPRRKSY